VKTLVLAALLAGCAPNYDAAERDGQAAAVAMVWNMYERADEPPAVRWVTGAELNCVDPDNGKPGFTVALFWCRDGATFDGGSVYVAWREGDRMADTSLHHELQHAAMARRGIFDPLHLRGEWAGVVEAAFVAELQGGM
jgi:hypothetical protein